LNAGNAAPATTSVSREGEKFVPADVDAAHPVHGTTFDTAAGLKDWRMEGGKRNLPVDAVIGRWKSLALPMFLRRRPLYSGLPRPAR